MRYTFLLSFIFLSQLAHARIPVGRWLNPQLAQDDGAFGKYYQGWLIISNDSIDQIVTMGMHYNKTKLQILADDGHRLQLFDKDDNSHSEVEYLASDEELKMCVINAGCTTYRQTLQKPNTDPAPASYPQIHISTKWCVDTDCESVTFTGVASEMLYNLQKGFKPVFWQYAAPESLLARYGIRLHALSYSYRFSNDVSDLASFMTSLLLVAEQDKISETLARSGALVLKEGPLCTLQGTFLGHKIHLEFSLEKVK